MSMMSVETSILIGGMFNALFAGFHSLFWRLFNWRRDLASLSFINRQVMQILNLCLTFTFLIFAYISLVHAKDLMETQLGHALLILISAFWFLRAVAQVIFFHLKHKASVVFFITFSIGSLLYFYPWFCLLHTQTQ